MSMEGIRTRQHISSALGALLGAAVLCVAAPSSAMPIAALVASVTSSAQQPALGDEAGVQISRVFESPADGDIVSFSKADSDATPVTGSVFGFSMQLPLRVTEQTATPHVFAVSNAQPSTMNLPWNANPGAQAVGMQIDIPGGAQATFSMQSSTANLGPFSAPSQQPAVFAFFNFPERRAGLNLQPFGSADAATASSVTTAPSANANFLSSPLISAFSAQGPFWYNGSAPARGTTLSLTLPFRLARIPVKVSLGEQSLTGVPTSSLATAAAS